MTPLTRPDLVHRYFVSTPHRPSLTLPLALWTGGTLGALLSTWLVWRHGLLDAVTATLTGVFGLSGVFCLFLGAVQGWSRWRSYTVQWRLSQPKPTGAQMDHWRDQGIDDAVETGLRRLNLHRADLDPRRDILVFPGIPRITYAAVGEDDGVLRFPRYEILTVYLTSWRVSTFECVLDMYTGARLSEHTREFHLQQVDGIETRSDRIEWNLHSLASDTSPDQRPPAERLDGAPPAPAVPAAPNVDTFTISTMQQLHLVVSGRVAIELTIGLSANNAWVSSLDRPGLDQLIAQLREHLRGHMGGAQRTDERVAAAMPSVPGPAGLRMPTAGLPGENGTSDNGT